MKRVDADKIIDDIEQLRTNLGLSKAALAQLMGSPRRTAWAETSRKERHPQAHHQLHVIVKALKALGWGLYMAPLPREEQNGQR